MFAEIILKSKTKMTDRIFTYSIPDTLKENIKVGSRVIVPFGRGNNKRIGIIINLKDSTRLKKTKDIIELLDEIPIIDQEQIDLAFFMFKNYLSDLSSAFQTVLPPGNWGDIVEYFWMTDNKLDNIKKQDEFYELYIFLKDTRKSWPEIQTKFGNKYLHKDLIKLYESNILSHIYDIKNTSSAKYIKIVKLKKNFDKSKIRKNAFVQINVIEYLSDNNLKSEYFKLLKETGASSSTIKTLVEKDMIYLEEKRVFREIFEKQPNQYKKISLNKEQEKVFNTINNSTEQNKFLLNGITGSGKTEIYLQIVEEELKKGRQAIILVPEISLTPQTIERFAGRFPNQVAVLHSKLSINERFDQWKLIKSGKYKIVVGARSAIFAPLNNLGVIIIDEEHELSYISEKHPKYNAIDIANFRTDYNNSKLILGSATPSIDSYYNGINGNYKILKLENRATANPLPEIYTIDMKNELKSGNRSMFSNELKEKIEERLKNKEQTILFLNKRGHTSFVFCRRCGYVYKCSHCDISMTYHKSKNRLICHLCGRTAYKSNTCPECGSNAIREFGAGTEKLEEETIKTFPNARIYRIDGDTVSDKDAYNKLYEKMNNREIDILIGTQMISKGLDFENVTLVGVMAADISLNFGDYRAAERTYQLLTQVAGRAGRGQKKGQVIIQTYKPEHYAIKSSVLQNYEEFYNLEIGKRKLFKYPPFYRLINIKIIYFNRNKCREKAFEISKYINNELKRKKITDIKLIGPNPSPIDRINNMYRFDIIYKFNAKSNDIINIIEKIVKDNVYNIDLDGYRTNITIDPISFF